jgi:hypothetical protein
MDSNILIDPAGNLKLVDIFVNSWFFGIIDIAFLFVLFSAVFLLNRYGFRFGQMVGIVFALSLLFATISSSFIMWGIVVLIVVISGLRFVTNILLRI